MNDSNHSNEDQIRLDNHWTEHLPKRVIKLCDLLRDQLQSVVANIKLGHMKVIITYSCSSGSLDLWAGIQPHVFIGPYLISGISRVKAVFYTTGMAGKCEFITGHSRHHDWQEFGQLGPHTSSYANLLYSVHRKKTSFYVEEQ